MALFLNDCNLKTLLVSMIILIFSILINYYISGNAYNISMDLEKCPFCYGLDFCDAFKDNNITFNNLSIGEQLSNFVSSKNVYIANYKDQKVILKKLAHNWELEQMDKKICQNIEGDCPPYPGSKTKDYSSDILSFLLKNSNDYINLKICSEFAVDQFVNLLFAFNNNLDTNFMTASIWTKLLINVEPLILQMLNDNEWPVPKYLGACGRVVIEEYCGETLNSISEEPWIKRATIALHLLQAADDFTNKHPLFRFYLTDISPDNIAITQEGRIKFIDMENIIISSKISKFDRATVHESKDFHCENCYAFSADEICNHGISDHNYYSVCKLLLSRNAPWPMMNGGLLHSPPERVKTDHPSLSEYIEMCVESGRTSRFESSRQLMKLLEQIIDESM